MGSAAARASSVDTARDVATLPGMTTRYVVKSKNGLYRCLSCPPGECKAQTSDKPARPGTYATTNRARAFEVKKAHPGSRVFRIGPKP